MVTHLDSIWCLVNIYLHRLLAEDLKQGFVYKLGGPDEQHYLGNKLELWVEILE